MSHQVQITNAVCDLLGKLGTTLVLVDEIHNLDLTTRNGAEASDQLKYPSERIAATFVLAGLDVETSSLFQGTRGQQIAGRYTVITSRPFSHKNRADKEHRRSLRLVSGPPRRRQPSDSGPTGANSDTVQKRASRQADGHTVALDSDDSATAGRPDGSYARDPPDAATGDRPG
jgi:hypothetical protein